MSRSARLSYTHLCMEMYTVGHSTRTLEELAALLWYHGVQLVVDIRSFPTSARFPHFTKDCLASSLLSAGIEYVWLGKELGGLRKRGNRDSPHTALRSPGFRNYADHTATSEFREGIRKLLELAERARVALMCAERLWWRCHRSLLSDFLVACCEVGVVHIVEEGKAEPHRLHRAARLAEGRLVYDVGEQPHVL